MQLAHISKLTCFTWSMNLVYCKAWIHESKIQDPKIEWHIVMCTVLAGKPQYNWYGHMCAWGIHYGCIYVSQCVATIANLLNRMLSVDTRIAKDWWRRPQGQMSTQAVAQAKMWTGEYMDRQTDGCMDRWMNRQKDGQMDRWADGQMDRQTDGQMDRWTDAWGRQSGGLVPMCNSFFVPDKLYIKICRPFCNSV